MTISGELPRILIIPLASNVVPREEVIELLKQWRENSESLLRGIDIAFFPEIIDEKNIDKALSRINAMIEDVHGIVLMHLTGGTSKLALEVLINITKAKPFLVWAFGKFNSLASALNTKSRIQNLLNTPIPVPIVYEDIKPIQEFAVISKAIDYAYASHKILLLGPTTGVRVPRGYHIVQSLRLKNILKPVPRDILEEVIRRIQNWIDDAEAINDQSLSKALTIYVNVKDLLNTLMERKKVKVKLASIECYNLIKYYGVAPCLAVSLLLEDGYIITCQRDIPAIFGILLLKEITRNYVWLADISKIIKDEKILVFSHSCANPLLSQSRDKIRVLKHRFRPVYGVIRVPPPIGEDVTIVQIDLQQNKLIWYEGKIVGPARPYEDIEATQMSVKLKPEDFEKFLERCIDAHFLLTYGKWGHLIDRTNELLKQVTILRELKGV
ncbi:MAG: hypothetical protein ACTSX9_02010 [Candidatus Njordarchaeales archaeon]